MEGFFNEQAPAGVRIAQAVGLTTAGFIFGATTNMTFTFVPAILQAPAPLAAKQWHTMHDRIHDLMVGPLSIAASIAMGYVAYHEDTSSLAFKLNTAAAILFPAIMPITFTLIFPINNKLFEKEKSLASTSLEDKAAEAGIAKEETVHQLVDKWGTLNLVRSLITGAGFVCAVWAALDNKFENVAYSDFALKTGANRLG
ncbi:hypothetical protein EJ04DRAFT_449939 [Polyplosphaeria fusca]|uniref:DUF1772-domain-containing protein n=1 Tax=Polyplosphaeria fusca TaxID=682080 RepID=A0A9P4QNE7_9PLEO|nr:hypothetical protein EJ04DRAFT_449939 [Polyplosphaeria fusca]